MAGQVVQWVVRTPIYRMLACRTLAPEADCPVVILQEHHPCEMV